MSTKHLVLASTCALAAAAGEASAQPAQRIGQCYDRVVKRLYDVDSNGWFRNVANHAEQFRAVRDPSGMTLMLLPSGDPRARFWITWDQRVIRIEANGFWTEVGNCQLVPDFVRAQLPPQPPAFLPPVAIEHENSGSSSIQIPKAALEPDAEFLPAVIPTVDAVANCPRTSRKALYDCAAKNVLGQKERAIYDCITSAKSNEQDRALCLLESVAGKNERRAIQNLRACSAQLGTEWSKYPVCMADGQLDPKTVRALQCAQQSAQGGKMNYWQLAACYGGPEVLDRFKPNAEAMIIYECAMASGGEPELFVGCAGGRMVTAELDKCLTHGIGGDGCFGKNNTITRTLDEIGQSISDQFGEKSVFHDGWKIYRATMDPAAAAKAINSIAREGKKAAKNIETAVGKAAKDVARNTKTAADNVVRAAKKALPRIKW